MNRAWTSTMRQISVFLLLGGMVFGCGSEKAGDMGSDNDVLEPDRCSGMDPENMDWPSDGGAPVMAFLGNGDEISEDGDAWNSAGEYINGVVALSDDSFVIGGSFAHEATFGQGQAGEITLETAGNDSGNPDGDAFIARYGENGELLWVRQLKSRAPSEDTLDWVGSVSAFSDESFVVRGEFSQEVVLAAGEPNEVTLTAYPENGWDGFVGEFIARYGKDGALLWAIHLARGSTERTTDGGEWSPNDMAVLKDNAIVAVGQYWDDVVFAPGQERELEVSASDLDSNGYLLKLDASGRAVWVRTFAAGTNIERLGVATVCDGHILVTGFFEGTLVFGNAPEDKVTIADFPYGTFIARYYPNGDLKNAFVYGEHFRSWGGLSTFPDGTYLVAGFNMPGGHTVHFPGTMDDRQSGSARRQSGYLAVSRIDENDQPMWTSTVEGAVVPHSVNALADGSSVVTGSFRGEVVFGEGEENETTLVGYDDDESGQDGFVARFYSDGRLAWAHSVNGVDSTAPIKDQDVARTAAVLENSRKVVVGGQVWGDFAIDYETDHQWPQGETLPSRGLMDWYVAVFEL